MNAEILARMAASSGLTWDEFVLQCCTESQTSAPVKVSHMLAWLANKPLVYANICRTAGDVPPANATLMQATIWAVCNSITLLLSGNLEQEVTLENFTRSVQALTVSGLVSSAESEELNALSIRTVPPSLSGITPELLEEAEVLFDELLSGIQ